LLTLDGSPTQHAPLIKPHSVKLLVDLAVFPRNMNYALVTCFNEVPAGF
jgi:hypothetical protein